MRPANVEALARHPEVLRWLEEAPACGQVEEFGEEGERGLRIEGVLLQGRQDPGAEARLQAQLAPVDSPTVTLYGLGLGALSRELLRRPRLRELRVVVLNPGVARTVLERTDQSDWIGDPRVELVRGVGDLSLELPFCALPAHLRLASDEGLRLRDLVRMELDRPFQVRHHQRQEQLLGRRLLENRAFVAEDSDVGGLFDSLPGGVVHVAGAGPSLLEGLAFREANPGPLIAVDAALRPLLAAGIRPDFVVALDMHEDGLRNLFDVPAAELAGVSLVYFPSITGDVLTRFPGTRWVAYADRPAYAELAREHGRETLFSSGSVLHPAVDLAVRMGAERVVLHGADFAHLDGHTHAEGAAYRAPSGEHDGRPYVLDGRGQRVPSLANLVGYLRDLESYIAGGPEGVTFQRASDRGAMIQGTTLVEESHVR